MPRAAAFFDIDRTLVVGTSIENCFRRYAARQGALNLFSYARNIPTGLRALGLLPGSSADDRIVIPEHLPLTTRVRYAFLSGNKSYLRGLALDDCLSLAKGMLREQVLPLLSQRGRQLVQEHRQAGRLVVLLSGTLDFMAEPLQEYLGADYLLAACPEVCAGKLTGRLCEAHPYGVQKKAILARFAEEKEVDLPASYAYADHHTDAPFLEAVGHPVAVNPDRKLARLAVARGWKVERF